MPKIYSAHAGAPFESYRSMRKTRVYGKCGHELYVDVDTPGWDTCQHCEAFMIDLDA